MHQKWYQSVSLSLLDILRNQTNYNSPHSDDLAVFHSHPTFVSMAKETISPNIKFFFPDNSKLNAKIKESRATYFKLSRMKPFLIFFVAINNY